MDSYGYIEVVGLVPAIAAADAALKAANVEVVGRENTGKAPSIWETSSGFNCA